MTVPPGSREQPVARRPHPREDLVERLPAGRRDVGLASHADISAGHPRWISANVRPSHSPKSVSSRAVVVRTSSAERLGDRAARSAGPAAAARTPRSDARTASQAARPAAAPARSPVGQLRVAAAAERAAPTARSRRAAAATVAGRGRGAVQPLAFGAPRRAARLRLGVRHLRRAAPHAVPRPPRPSPRWPAGRRACSARAGST